jgi:hypothetical protein
MPIPSLELGLVVRYEYLWHRRRDASTADKYHPACVIATFRNEGVAEDFVVYLPISHTPPADGEVGVELSSHAKRVAGLDSAPQWLLISECNIDMWPQDLRSLPGQSGRFHYGRLPPSEFRHVRDQFVARYRQKKVKQVLRHREPGVGT